MYNKVSFDKNCFCLHAILPFAPANELINCELINKIYIESKDPWWRLSVAKNAADKEFKTQNYLALVLHYFVINWNGFKLTIGAWGKL